MKTKSLKIIGILGLSLLLVTSSFAISSTPVGYVTFTVQANSDLKLGINMDQAASFSGAVSSVTSGAIDAGSAVGDLTTVAHFVRITTGALAGNWYEVTSASANEINVAENLASLGLLANDEFTVIPFWTYDTLMPGGGGLTTSSNIFGSSPIEVYTYNPADPGVNNASTGAYVYDAVGMLGFTGWVNVATFGPGGSDRINPDTFIQIRNNTTSDENFVLAGTVPTSNIAFNVVTASTAQDNLIYNPFPAAVSLASSGLETDGAINPSFNIFDPNSTDTLFVYSMDSTGLNPATSAAYVYDAVGMLGFTGWVNLATFAPAGAETIEPGQAIMIRKAPGTPTDSTWSANIPYTLTTE